jgi:Fe-S cluster assembly ATPase SufC
MSRRAALPGANELFRATSSAAALAEAEPAPPASREPAAQAEAATIVKPPQQTAKRTHASGESTGRERHDEKITVYLSADELVLLDEAKAALYRDQGLKVDRGRIVREAVSVVIGDLAAKGEASILARRLREG